MTSLSLRMLERVAEVNLIIALRVFDGFFGARRLYDLFQKSPAKRLCHMGMSPIVAKDAGHGICTTGHQTTMPNPVKAKINLSSSILYDALVIGAGPAGLSTALALSRVKRTAAVFGNNQYRNAKAHRAHTILTRDHTEPAEIQRLGKLDVQKYGTTQFVDRGIAKAQKDEHANVFEVVDTSVETWQGRKIVLAMGSEDLLPTDVPGYSENWGSNIYQCLFCDGLERSHLPAGIIGFDHPMYLHYVSTCFQLGCPKVTIFSNGASEPADEGTKHALKVAKYKGATVEERKIARLVDAGDEGVDVEFEDGPSQRVGFLCHKPLTGVVAQCLVEDLGVEMVALPSEDKIVKRSEPFGETNICGVFAAGDIGVMMKQVTAAMFSGVCAGGGVHMQLSNEEEAELKVKNGARDTPVSDGI